MKINKEIKKWSNKDDINRTRPRHGYEYAKYKTCLSMIIVVRNKQHVGNIWSWINEKVKERWGWEEKKHCLQKKRVFFKKKKFKKTIEFSRGKLLLKSWPCPADKTKKFLV